MAARRQFLTDLDLHIVDQAHVIIVDGSCEKGRTDHFGKELQVLAVDQLKIVDLQAGRSIVQKMMTGGLKIDFAALFPGLPQVAGSEEGTVDTGSISAVFLAQGEVA